MDPEDSLLFLLVCQEYKTFTALSMAPFLKVIFAGATFEG